MASSFSLDAVSWSAAYASLLRERGTAFRCQIPRNLLSEGEHALQIVVIFADQTSRRNAVHWSVVGASR